MSENVQITPGSGVTIGADSITDITLGSAQIQYIKIMDGAIGGTNKAGVTTNGLKIDGSGVTQPISATVLPLPTNASTATNQTTELSYLSTIVTNTTNSGMPTVSGTVTVLQPTAANLNATVVQTVAGELITESWMNDGSGNSLSSTSGSLDVNVTNFASTIAVTQSTSPWVVSGTVTTSPNVNLHDGSGNAISSIGGSLSVEITNFPNTQPVSGTVTAQIEDSSGNALNSTAGALNVQVENFPTSQTINGTVAATQSGTWTVALSSGSIEIGKVDQGTPNTLANAWPVIPTDGTNSQTFTASGEAQVTVTEPLPSGTNVIGAVIQSGTWNLNNITGIISLPTGAATDATLSSLNSKVTIVNTGAVTISTALPAGANVIGHVITDSGSTIAVTGNVSVVQSTASNLNATVTGTIVATQATGTNLHTVIDSGTITVSNATLAVTQSGTWNIGTLTSITNPVAVTGTFWQTTQPISGTVTANQGTSPWVVSLSSTTITGTVTAAGNLTHNNAAPIANNIGVLPAIASSSVPTYITGDQVLLSTDLSGNLRVTIDSTSAEQNVNLNQVGGSAISIGQATMAASLPIVIASNQSSIPVTLASTTITGTVAVTQSTSPWVVSGTVTANAGTGTFAVSAASLPLPTGASTSAKQPALGTAGTASSDVITVQGIASMTALKVDGSAVTQPISGSVSISNFPATQPVSGTITANQGTSPWVVSLASTTITGTVAVTQSTSPWVVSGTVTSNIGTTNGLALDATIAALEVGQASTTSGQKGILQLGAVTTGSPTYTTAQTSALSLTTAGALRVDASATTQPISGSVTVANATIAVTQSGTWNLNNISGTISLPTGASTEATLSSLNGKVTAVNTGAVTISTALPAGTNVIGHVIADSGSTTAVTGNVSVVQTTAANLNATVVGTVTANQGTANATPWNENISQVGGNAVATAASGIMKVGVTDGSGNSVTSTTDGSQRGIDTNIINIQDNMGTGTIVALNGTVTAITNGSSVVNFQVTGTWSATLTIQGSVDGTTWNTIVGDVDSTDTIESTITANTFVSVGSGGFQQVRLQATAFSSGTVNIAWEASLGSSLVEVYNTNPASLQTTVTPIAITKGTQGATGFTTQDLKDAGRTFITFTADAIAGVTTEALVSFTLNKAGTTTAAQTNYTITSGKTLRIQTLSASVQAGAAAGEWLRAKLRINTAGATTATSPLIVTVEAGNIAATTATAGTAVVAIPDGLEITGNGTITIGLSHLSSATTNTESISLVAYEY